MYASNTDIQAEYLNITWNSATLSSTKVDEFCSQAGEYIDAKIGTKYVLPIDSGAVKTLKLLKMLTIWMVKERLKAIIQTKTGSNKADAEDKINLQDKADKMLDSIRKGEIELLDAKKVGTGDGVGSYVADNAGAGCGSGPGAVFKRGKDQW